MLKLFEFVSLKCKSIGKFKEKSAKNFKILNSHKKKIEGEFAGNLHIFLQILQGPSRSFKPSFFKNMLKFFIYIF